MHICPFIRSECGPSSKINFYSQDEDGAIHIKNLDKGDACVYNIETVCGAPAVKVNNGTGTSIFYTEWQQDAIVQNTPRTGLAFDSPAVMTSSPAPGMPVRNQQFVYDRETSTDRAAVFGMHKKTGWKSWGNKKQDEKGNPMANGRRYADTDNICTLRNMQIAVIAMQDDVQMLLEVEA